MTNLSENEGRAILSSDSNVPCSEWVASVGRKQLEAELWSAADNLRERVSCTEPRRQ